MKLIQKSLFIAFCISTVSIALTSVATYFVLALAEKNLIARNHMLISQASGTPNAASKTILVLEAEFHAFSPALQIPDFLSKQLSFSDYMQEFAAISTKNRYTEVYESIEDNNKFYAVPVSIQGFWLKLNGYLGTNALVFSSELFKNYQRNL